MWIPKNETETLEVISKGELAETRTFDAKKEIPAKELLIVGRIFAIEVLRKY